MCRSNWVGKMSFRHENDFFVFFVNPIYFKMARFENDIRRSIETTFSIFYLCAHKEKFSLTVCDQYFKGGGRVCTTNNFPPLLNIRIPNSKKWENICIFLSFQPASKKVSLTFFGILEICKEWKALWIIFWYMYLHSLILLCTWPLYHKKSRLKSSNFAVN